MTDFRTNTLFIPTPMPQTRNAISDGIYLKSIVRSVLGKHWDIPQEELSEQFIQQLEWVNLGCGERLYEQGAVGDCMHILISGRLKVVKEKDEEVIAVDEISSGECVGEMSLMSDNPRSAGIFAARDSVLVKITREQFNELCGSHPQLLRQISKMVIDRLGNKNKTLKTPAKVKNIAIIPLSNGLDMKNFTQRIQKHLCDVCNIQLLNDTNVNQYLDGTPLADFERNPSTNLRFSRCLERVEHENDYVIYQGNFSDDYWTRNCIRQADKIILVKDFYDTQKSAYRQELMNEVKKLSYVNKTLVFVHPDGTKAPQNTKDHVELEEVDIHHHLRLNRTTDYGRLSRFITGKAIGLVLGGGGAKGFAHIGIIRRLRESGIPIDYVGGTSIGAIIGGCVAMDMDDFTMHQQAKEAFIKDKPLSDVTIPFVSYYSGRKLDKSLRKNFGEQDIEDLWINFFCVSSNLTKAGTKIHKSGQFWKAVRASMSLPGAFPPVVMGNDLLVDGGLMNNVPIDIMANMGVGKIIGVDLNVEKEYELSYDKIPGSFQLFRNKFVGRKKRIKVPGLMTILSKSIVLSSYEKASTVQNMADWFMRPPVQKFGMLQFKSFDKITNIGYGYADEMLKVQPELCAKFYGKE